jgi:hypothetical protein
MASHPHGLLVGYVLSQGIFFAKHSLTHRLGVGQLIAGLFAWAFLPNFSNCGGTTGIPCTYDNNKGWRYVWYANGALVFVMSILRVTVIRLKETPKFLVAEGKDDRVVEVLQGLAHKYNRPCSLTLEKLQACGVTGDAGRRGSVAAHAKSRFSPMEVATHLRGLYETRRIGLSTTLIWFSWLLIGCAYPLYNVYLPTYLATRGAEFGEPSQYITWRNYAIVNVCSIFGPILAGGMCASRLFYGRRGTMAIGAIITMVFFFAYTQVRSAAQNLGFNCAISFCLVRSKQVYSLIIFTNTRVQNIYYGCLYAYTPEVLPSAHRGTGNGIAIGLNRVMGIMSGIIAEYANVSICHPFPD